MDGGYSKKRARKSNSYILGIHPTLDGLQIAPVIPREWKGFEAVRVFRGVRYEISVNREGTGYAVSLIVDEKPIPGNVIPLPKNGTKVIKVKAILK